MEQNIQQEVQQNSLPERTKIAFLLIKIIGFFCVISSIIYLLGFNSASYGGLFFIFIILTFNFSRLIIPSPYDDYFSSEAMSIYIGLVGTTFLLVYFLSRKKQEKLFFIYLILFLLLLSFSIKSYLQYGARITNLYFLSSFLISVIPLILIFSDLKNFRKVVK